jgi:hypothetical protein
MQVSYGVYFNPKYPPSGLEATLLDTKSLTSTFAAQSTALGFGPTVGRVIARGITRRYYGTQPSPPPPAPPPTPTYPPGMAPPTVGRCRSNQVYP